MTQAAPGIDNILLLKNHRLPARQTLRTAIDLARRCSAQLTFADALQDRDQTPDLFQKARLHELESLLSPHLDGMAADYRLVDGDLAAATAKITDEFDLVFLADDSQASGASDHDVKRLLRRSSLPVWLDSGVGHTPRRILAAVDTSTQDPLKRRLNEPILARALLLASVYNAELDILNVWTPPMAPLAFAHRVAGSSEHLISQDSEGRRRLEQAVGQALELSLPLEREPRILITEGLPAEAIALTTEAHRTDLLVAGCVGRDGLAAWLVGDTAEKLSRRLDCSILAIKATSDPFVRSNSVGRGRAA